LTAFVSIAVTEIRTSTGRNEQGKQRAGEGFHVDHIYKLHQSRIVGAAHVPAELDDRTNAFLSVVYESEHGVAASGSVNQAQSLSMLYGETRADISLRRSNFFMNKLGLAILAFSIFLTACEDPAANKARAITSTTSTTTANTQKAVTAAKGDSLAVTPENSKVLFTGSKVTGKHDGGFNKFSGVIELVNGKPEESKVYIDIDAGSVFTDADGLTEHLQTGDFFDIKKFPKASFGSTTIVPDAAKGANAYTVTGDLELRGVRKSVTFPATIAVTPADVTVNSEFSINRKDFGILYAGKADDLIRDDVVIKLDLRTPRKQ
jgi:polyisoprenoid-binding protein YceI